MCHSTLIFWSQARGASIRMAMLSKSGFDSEGGCQTVSASTYRRARRRLIWQVARFPYLRRDRIVNVDYDLDRLGPHEFEKLAQALAVAELGNGLSVFGDGPDGQREATFDGPVNFPEGHGAIWSGYGVVQAKHRRSSVPGSDGRWLRDQLQRELNTWHRRTTARGRSKARAPQYLLVITNIRLTGVHQTGGKDLIDELMESQAAKLHLRGWHVWSHTEISALLDIHEDIRRRYAAFLTTSDVIARMHELLGDQSLEQTAQSLTTHAAKQLVSKQWVRLSESGYSGGEKLSITSLGIDLPAIEVGPGVDTPPETAWFPIAKAILEYGDTELRPGASARSNGVVLIGGPGQGKSTITQLICHAYRLALIDGSEMRSLGPVGDEVREAMRQRLDKLGLGLPAYRRWPVYIELAKFAEELQGNPEFSLLRYIAQQVDVSGSPLKTAALTTWLKSWPWVVVLDGLDEVPIAELRDRVIQAVSDFIIEASAQGADILLIGTTRPQGYHNDFGHAFRPQQFQLKRLNRDQALAYGAAIADLRLSDEDPDGASQVKERLREAAEAATTQRLMTTPLQVTIMCSLAERQMSIPLTRHELFEAYYGAVFTREKAGKAMRASKLMGEHAELIHRVHETVAIDLQTAAELYGNASARLKQSQLRETIRQKLQEFGYDESDRAKLAEELLKVATDRLVLLVPHRAYEYGFEVRSLQEYMAARAINRGDDDIVIERLRIALPSSFWRNTWLLAVARLFRDREHAQERVLSMIQTADNESVFSLVTRPGSQATVDLLADDVAANVPALRRRLLQSTLDLLGRPPADFIRAFQHILEASENDRMSQVLIRQRLEDAASSPSGTTAKLLLTAWLKRPGVLGIAARKILGVSNTRPSRDPRTESFAAVLGPAIDTSTLTVEQGHQLKKFLKYARSSAVPIGVPVDTTRAMTLRLTPTISGELHDLLSAPELREVLAEALEQLRGDHPEVAVALAATFDEWSESQQVSREIRLTWEDLGRPRLVNEE